MKNRDDFERDHPPVRVPDDIARAIVAGTWQPETGGADKLSPELPEGYDEIVALSKRMLKVSNENVHAPPWAIEEEFKAMVSKERVKEFFLKEREGFLAYKVPPATSADLFFQRRLDEDYSNVARCELNDKLYMDVYVYFFEGRNGADGHVMLDFSVSAEYTKAGGDHWCKVMRYSIGMKDLLSGAESIEEIEKSLIAGWTAMHAAKYA